MCLWAIRKMIGLQATLDQDLPIGRAHIGNLMDELQVPGIEPGKVAGKAFQKSVNIWCCGPDSGNPDPAVGFATAEADESEALTVDLRKTRCAMRYSLQLSAVVVGPGVIGTRKPSPATAVLIDYSGPTMPADVQKRMHSPVVVSGQEQRPAGMFPRQERVLAFQFARMRHDCRQAAEQVLLFLLKSIRAGISLNRRCGDGVVEVERPSLAPARPVPQAAPIRSFDP